MVEWRGACAPPRRLHRGSRRAGPRRCLIAQRNGYAPAFSRAGQASVADWALDDIVALLRSLPVERNPAPEPLRNPADTARRVALGAALSADHCAACHGAQGEGGQLAS